MQRTVTNWLGTFTYEPTRFERVIEGLAAHYKMKELTPLGPSEGFDSGAVYSLARYTMRRVDSGKMEDHIDYYRTGDLSKITQFNPQDAAQKLYSGETLIWEGCEFNINGNRGELLLEAGSDNIESKALPESKEGLDSDFISTVRRLAHENELRFGN
jgi:hypothetical protein